ncbi:MAG: cystathionine gamma-synthase family protein [Casimicrobiaceae bacterium]
MNKQGFTTTILHGDRRRGTEFGATHAPVHPSAAFGYGTVKELVAVFQGDTPGFVYGRQHNPTVSALEAKITAMEDGQSTACFATGMAGIAAMLWALLKRGDHVVVSSFVFGNTNSLYLTLSELGCDVTFVDATAVANVEAALQPETRLVFVETIANPRTQVADLDAIGKLCAARNLVYVVDNTMSSPALFRPKSVGASLILNSLTKYIGGHGHALGGALTATGLYDWADYPHIQAPYKKGASMTWGLTQIRKKGLRDAGGTLSAAAAHAIAVGAETLALRMERTCSNALAVARFLSVHPRVAKVHYPGLPTHAQHRRAAELFKGFGGLFAFELKDGFDCFQLLDAMKVVMLSSNLGDTRTLALPAAHTIFFEMGAERRASMGIADSLIRVSVGIEDEADLLGDFEQALEACSARVG